MNAQAIESVVSVPVAPTVTVVPHANDAIAAVVIVAVPLATVAVRVGLAGVPVIDVPFSTGLVNVGTFAKTAGPVPVAIVLAAHVAVWSTLSLYTF